MQYARRFFVDYTNHGSGDGSGFNELHPMMLMASAALQRRFLLALLPI